MVELIDLDMAVKRTFGFDHGLGDIKVDVLRVEQRQAVVEQLGDQLVEVVQLAEAIASDKQYYAMDSIDVNTDAVLFNGTVQTKPGSGTVSMHLGGPINSMLQMTANRDAFAEATKGLRISVLPTGSDEGMVAMNLSDTRTLIRVHYHYDTTSYHFDLSISNGKHFTHFVHDYSGTVLDGVRSLDGASRLYLDPLGGFKAVVSFDRTLRAFREAHPRAVVHKADLLIPVAAEADAKKPHRLMAERPRKNDALGVTLYRRIS